MDAEATEVEDMHKIKIVFLGDRSVGKTSIIKRFIRDQFTEKQNPTVGIDFMFKTVNYHGKGYKLELWDTAGQEKYRSLVKNYLRDADCCLFIYDVNQSQTYNHLLDWIGTFNESAKQCEPLSFIVGNKIDLKEDDISRDGIDANFITNREIKQLQTYEHIEVSAKRGININNLFEKILSHMEKRKPFVGSSNKYIREDACKNEQAKKHCCLG